MLNRNALYDAVRDLEDAYSLFGSIAEDEDYEYTDEDVIFSLEYCEKALKLIEEILRPNV